MVKPENFDCKDCEWKKTHYTCCRKPPMRISNADVSAAMGFAITNEYRFSEVMDMIRLGLTEERPVHFSKTQNSVLMSLAILAGSAKRDYETWKKESAIIPRAGSFNV